MREQYPTYIICKEIYYKALAPVIIETDRSVSWQAGDPGDNGIVFILVQQAQDPGRADISVGSPKAGKKPKFQLKGSQAGGISPH